MIHTIDPGRTRPSIFMFDHIPYSHVTDLDGNPLTLELSILSQMEGSELQVALGRKQPEERPDAVKVPAHALFISDLLSSGSTATVSVP